MGVRRAGLAGVIDEELRYLLIENQIEVGKGETFLGQQIIMGANRSILPTAKTCTSDAGCAGCRPKHCYFRKLTLIIRPNFCQ